MKHIKSYKIFESTNLDLDKILKKFDISDYTLNDDGSIDINQDVYISKNISEINLNFNKIYGHFSIANNHLLSLANCPKYIDGLFDCSSNQIESLEFGPEYVGGSYGCDHNKLETLNGCVDEVYGDFNCHNNKLTSLEFCPMEIEGTFNCSDNNLTELDRSPFVRGNLWCYGMFKTKPIFNGDCKHVEWLG